jgi:hypothetical protein
MAYEIPEAMVAGYGYPQLTREIKAKILGANFARMHGIDLEAQVAALPDDELRRAQREGMAEPWSRRPALEAA